ncbi:MAG: hypothetical protein JWM47_2234 [Acidimicrobiales bacterium]|nr:hypothetical protein [Acidimicrobiales bacterium]
MTTDTDPDSATSVSTAEPKAKAPSSSAKPATAPRATAKPAGAKPGEPGTGTTGKPAGARGSRPRRSWGARIPWLLAVLGLIGTVGFAIAWQGARDDANGVASASVEGESADMADAARTFSLALTNFDGATIDRDFDRLVALSTGEFRGQADEFFSSKVRKQLKEAQASSRGEVRSAYVQSFDGDRGTAFVVVDQTIANNTAPKPQADTLRMELSLVWVDGRWGVSRVAILEAPSGGDTLAGPAGAAPASGTDSGG